MHGITFKNKKYQKRFENLINSIYDKLTEIEKSLIKITIVHYKKYNPDEYYILLGIFYGLLHFSIVEIKDIDLTKKDIYNLGLLRRSYEYEIRGEKEKYIDNILEMNEDLFILKMIIKYTILSSGDKYLSVIYDHNSYSRFIGYIIPYLTLKEFKLLGFFQDIYFKKMYPEEYEKTKKHYFENINDFELPGIYISDIVNDMSELMTKVGIFGIISVRKKSYFSIYNKLVRKEFAKINDSIGIRIVFKNIGDLKRFIKIFEDICVYEKKKDYISKPKDNGYKSLHYSFLNPYRDREINVDLQLRTYDMDMFIKKSEDISHYKYTLNQNKWSDMFKEVWYGYEYMNEKLNKKN